MNRSREPIIDEIRIQKQRSITRPSSRPARRAVRPASHMATMKAVAMRRPYVCNGTVSGPDRSSRFWLPGSPTTRTKRKKARAVPTAQRTKVRAASLALSPATRAARACHAARASESAARTKGAHRGDRVSVMRMGSMIDRSSAQAWTRPLLVGEALLRGMLLRDQGAPPRARPRPIQEEHDDADRDAGVGDVEGGPVAPGARPARVEPMPVDEVDDVAAQEPVDAVAERAAGQERERDLEVALRGVEVAVGREEEDDGRDRDQVEERDAKFFGLVREQAPGGAAVLRVAPLPEAVDDARRGEHQPALEQGALVGEGLHLLRRRARADRLEGGGEVLDGQVLGDLIAEDDRAREESEHGPLRVPSGGAHAAHPETARAQRLQRGGGLGSSPTSWSARQQRSQLFSPLLRTRASTMRGAPSGLRRSRAVSTSTLAQRKRSASCPSYFSATSPSRPAAASRARSSVTSASVALPSSLAARFSSRRALTASRKSARYRNSSSSESSASCGCGAGSPARNTDAGRAGTVFGSSCHASSAVNEAMGASSWQRPSATRKSTVCAARRSSQSFPEQ